MSKISDKLISFINNSLGGNDGFGVFDSDISVAIKTIEVNGFIDIEDVKILAALGLPVINIICKILCVTSEGARDMVVRHEISYKDMLCMIGIFAQDLKCRTQSTYSGSIR